MYDLYDCQPLLRMPSKVTIKSCIFGKDPNGLTLVLYSDNYHIIYCHITESQLKSDFKANVFKNNLVLRQIPIDKSKGELRSMALNESSSQLIIIVANSHIFLIPIQRLISHQNDGILRDDAIAIECCSLSNPTAIVWWNSLDHFNQMAIVGNDFGEISFIDIKNKREIGGTYVQNSVKRLEVMDDRSAVSLIIWCKNETQFRLILEETRRKGFAKTKVDPNVKVNDHYLFNCFITASEERESIGPNNCWNFKPIPIDMSNDNNVQETNELIATTVVYQKPFILSISEAMSETEEFGQLIVRLFSNKEFDYTFSTFSAKYLIPKQSSLPINSVLLTDRLFFVCTANNCSIVSKELSDSRKIAKLNPIIQKFNFDAEEQVINSFIFLTQNERNDKNTEYLDSFLIITSKCIHVCHQKQSCHQVFHSTITNSLSSGVIDSRLLVRAQRFASMLDFNLNHLYEKSADYCLERRQFSSAVRFYQLAKTAQIKRIANFVSFGYFTETIAYIEVLFSSKSYEIEDPDRIHFANIAINCFVQQLLEKSVKSNDLIVRNNLKTFLKNNLYYDESVVLRLFVEQGLLDLGRYCAQLRGQYGLFLSYLLKSSYLRSNSLKNTSYETILGSDYKELLNTSKCFTHLTCFTSPEITYSLILHKKLISKYLRFVIKLLPNLEMPFLVKLAVIFDPRRSATQLLLNRVLSQLKQTYLNVEDIDQQIIQKKDVLNLFIFITLMIISQNGSVSDFEQKFISIQPFVRQIETANKKQLLIETITLSAGASHSAHIRNGCLYLWGKSQFGCSGLQSNDFKNTSKLITEPTRLDLFTEVLSISVKSVSCGSHHSLVLTDFGVYAFGSSRFGQLGLGKDVILSRNPIIISELVNKDIVKIECGQYHSLAISCTGVLWTWGWNLHGQLGLNHIDDVHTPQVVHYLSKAKIIQAFGGFGHTIALDSNGFVYAFGNGTYGQLGLGTTIKHSIPQKVCLLSEPIATISTKYFHSLALSQNNKTLYIWGSNPQLIRIEAHYVRKSRLNQKTSKLMTNVVPNQDYLKPQKVDIFNITAKIVKIRTGSLHSLLLTTNGEMFSFGRGIDGQLGHGKVKELKTPTRVVFTNELPVNIVDIAAGSDYSLAVDTNGNVWGFGNNSDAQIGPKKSAQNNNYLIDDKNKKISIKTNRRLITFVSGGKSIEQLPIRINVSEDLDNYCDSLNYSLDINAMITSTQFSIIDDNINVLTDENSVSFDRQILAKLLAFYKQDLDLNSIQNRFKSFKCYQMTAFVYELQNDFPNALDFQLKALMLSIPKDSEHFTAFYTKIFHILVVKAVENIEKMTQFFEIFFKFWTENKLSFDSLELFLEISYRNEIKDSMFGISFFNFLKHNQNFLIEFNAKFLLEMVDFTIEMIAKRPQNLFSYQKDIERITSDIENISFPAEKLWQNILTHFQCNKTTISGHNISVEIEAIDEEILVFNCTHFYGLNEFKVKIVPNFELDIKRLGNTETKELEIMLNLYKNLDKEIWNNVCPLCFITRLKADN